MAKKVKLEQLKIKSFITELSNRKALKGGLFEGTELDPPRTSSGPLSENTKHKSINGLC